MGAPATMPKNAATNAGNVSFGEKVAYGMGNFGTQMVFNPATTFMVFFYTDIAGIAAATVGTILFLSRFLDVLNPVMGVIVDRTNTRFGKARPWLLWMAVPFGIAAALLFTSPNLGPTAKIIWAFVTYNLAFTLIYTAVDIPYSSLLPLMTTDSQERTTLSVVRMILSNAGIVISFAITMPLVKALGDGKQGWQRAFMIFGALAVVSILVCYAGTKERIKATGHSALQVPLKDGVSALFRNKYFVLLGSLAVTLFLMLGLLVANLYYCRYFLHKAELFGPLMTMMVLAQIFGMFFVPRIVKTFGKRNTALAGLLVTMAGQLMLYVNPLTFTLLAIGTVIKGLGAAPLIGTLFAMCADSIDFGEWQSGFRIDGLVFGAMALAMKISIGIGNVLVGWILAWGGYVAASEAQSAKALEAIKILFLHLPLLFYVIAFLILLGYNLDKRYPEIAATLQQRRAQQS
jgi:glycoside/pentoside/hexuronide:cation symporter, GPH family